MHAPPAHQPSLPAMASAPPFPLDIAALPASTRTSFTRVDHDHTRPTTAAGPRPSEDRTDAYSLAAEGSGAPREGAEKAPPPPPPPPPDEAAPRAEPVPQTPQTAVTFLLVSGKRRAMAFEPATTVGRVKELVWNSWPNDWQDERPPAPSYFRILHLGKILQDDDTLSQLGFPAHVAGAQADAPPPPSTIVHLSIRASAPPPEADGFLKKRARRRIGEAGEGTACCCVIC